MGEYDDKNRLLHKLIPNPTWNQFVEAFDQMRKRERRFAGVTVTSQDGSFLLVDGSDGLFFACTKPPTGFDSNRYLIHLNRTAK